MSKSVLVIDTPKNCMEGHLLTLLMIGGKPTCMATRNHVYSDKLKSEKPEWCPLMDLPEKDTGIYPTNTVDAGYAEGWNTCLDEITGGED